MEGRRFGVYCACLCSALACSGVWGAQEPTRSDRSPAKDVRAESTAALDEQLAVEFAVGDTYPVPADMPSHVVFVGADDRQSVVAGPSLGVDREVYTNRFGWTGINAGTSLVADDITTTAKDGCKLTRYSFEITGRVNPNIAGGNFSVSYALYNVCPGAVTTTAQLSRQIVGTQGTLVCPSENCPDPNARITIVHTVPTEGGTAIPPRVWLGMRFNRTNAGPIAGSPPEEGFSYDIYDTPNFKCETGIGFPYPQGPHASFNARLWAGTELEPCPPISIGYHSHREKPRTEAAVFNPGADKWVVDDLFFQHSCRMVGYTVTVSEQGNYSFEFRPSCEGTPYTGTPRQFSLSSTNNQTRNLVFMMDNPVNLGTSAFFAAKVTNSVGKILAGAKPIVGVTDDVFAIQDMDGAECVFQNAISGADDALSVTVLCEGAAPLGACCDMFVPQCVGGPDDGRGCQSNAQCTSPGTCERVCRQLSDANCTFPPAETSLVPVWEEGDACEPSPFPNAPCGVAACCHYDQAVGGEADCTDLTRNECPPFGGTHQWQVGELCNLQQECPLLQCLDKPNSCLAPCSTCSASCCTGCNNAECCNAVCREDPECCTLRWDELCVDRANGKPECTGEPPNDVCWSDRPNVGAFLVDPPLLRYEIASSAYDEFDDDDPPVCCHEKRCLRHDMTFGAECTSDANCLELCVGGFCLGGVNHEQPCTSSSQCPASPGACRLLSACVGGDDEGNSCITDNDCPFGTCQPRPPFALHTAWFKFVADNFTGININTCGSSGAPPLDTIIQLFEAGDTSSDQAACRTLTPVGCSDDSTGCDTKTLSRLCVSNLKANGLYYAMIGAKTREAGNRNYRVTFQTTACTGSDRAGEDWCAKAPNALDGNTTYTFPSSASLDCPGDSCRPEMTKDVWFNYTATCTGDVYVKTCHIPSANPDTTLAVYKGCDLCPAPGETTPYCNDNRGPHCPAGSVASSVTVDDVTLGDCLKIRIGDKNGNTPNGTMNIFCDSNCDPGTVTFIDPPNNVVDAGRPHDPLFLDPALGIREIRVQGPVGVERAGCWRVDCESASGDEANAIEEVVPDPNNPGGFIVRLARPITTEATTIVRYLGNPTNEAASAIRMTAHPGNVTGDFIIMWDIAISTLVNIANEENAGNVALFPPWGEKYGADINRSGDFNHFDVLDLIDLRNAAETYDPINIVRPSLCTP